MDSERIYRDSVHNIIRLKTDSAEGELLAKLIDSAEFQRLRRVRQLGLAHFAYQAAEHSRFTHSLGAFHLATRCLAKLSSDNEISPEQHTAVRVAALLHDIGHGAFSHVIEPILGFHHENFTVEAILSLDTEVGKILSEYSPQIARDAADIITGKFKPMALSQLVSSQLDVDRMDYLLRDSLMTGVKYGIFDLEWIIKSLRINRETDQLYVSARGIYAVEDYLQARYYMYRQVYFHRTLRSAEAILHSLLKRALFLYKTNGDISYPKNSAFEKILQSKRLTLTEHLSLDDSDLLYHIKLWNQSFDPILADLSRRFINRNLFKSLDLDMPKEICSEFVSVARSKVADAGFDPEYYFIEDTAGNAAHHFYTLDETKPKNMIYVEHGFSHPEIKEISEVSSAVRGLQQGYRLHRIAFPVEVKQEIEAIYHG